MAREIDDARRRHVGQITIHRRLRTRVGVGRERASGRIGIRKQRRIDRPQLRRKVVIQRIGIVSVGQIARVADVIGVDPDGKLRTDLAHVVGGERAALTDLVLDSQCHMHDARRFVIGREQSAKIRDAVGERVDVGAAGHLRLRRHELRLQVLNRSRNRTDRLAADLRRDIQTIDGVHNRPIGKQHRSRRTERQAAVILPVRNAVDAVLIRVLHQEIVEEHSAARANHSFAVVPGVPGHARLRSKIMRRRGHAPANRLKRAHIFQSQ